VGHFEKKKSASKEWLNYYYWSETGHVKVTENSQTFYKSSTLQKGHLGASVKARRGAVHVMARADPMEAQQLRHNNVCSFHFVTHVLPL